MNLTLKQRLGLERARITRRERRALLAARSASVLFAAQSALAVGAPAIGGTLDGTALGAAALTLSSSLLILFAYERLPWFVNQLLAVGAVGTVALLVAAQPHGERYAFLFVPLVLYVSFFFRGRNAVMLLAFTSILGAISLAIALPAGGAAETWALAVGVLVQAAGTTIALRRNLVRALDRSRSNRAVLDAVFLNAPGGFAFLDGELRYRRVNPTLAALLGRAPEDILGRTTREISVAHANVVEPLMQRVIERGTPLTGFDMSSADGERHYLVSYYPVAAEDGPSGVGVALTDVTHLKDVERRLEDTNRRLTVLATTDELTGLPNRRMLAEQLDLALERARRGGGAVAALCLDLDGFKDVNDSLGHAYGDELLIEVATKLRSGARATDVVARVGGDEFVILLADLDVQDAPNQTAMVVARLRSLLAETIPIGPVELKVDASIGVAVYPLDSRDAKGLLAAADAAMYAGKGAFPRVA